MITKDHLTDQMSERLHDCDHLVVEVAARLTLLTPHELRAEYVAAEQYLLAFIADCAVQLTEYAEEQADD